MKRTPETDYRSTIRAAVRGLWSGVFSVADFVRNMSLSIERYFTKAWYDGAADCGISPPELTLEELNQLRYQINSEISYTYAFANSINSRNRTNGYRLGEHFERADMWVNAYVRIRAMAKSYACQDQKLEWRMNPLKEHCQDCLRLDGRVYRASIWKKYNLFPRSRSLACKGYRCGCDLLPTTKPLTRGRPPRLW